MKAVSFHNPFHSNSHSIWFLFVSFFHSQDGVSASSNSIESDATRTKDILSEVQFFENGDELEEYIQAFRD